MNNLAVTGIGVAAFGLSLLALQYGAGVAGPEREGPTRSAVRPVVAPAAAVVDPGTELRSLRQSQADLRATVARLERRLEALEIRAAEPAAAELGAPATLTATDSGAFAPTDSGAFAPAVDDAPPERPSGASESRESRSADAERAVREQLVASGFAPDETEAIIRAVDENTLKRLELRYRIARGGEEGRLARSELRQMPSAAEVVREEFGADAYDRYLYAMGQPNRVVVRGVLRSSPAQAAGLRSGDTLLAFDDQPVYALHDLVRIASTGSDADLVTLTVLRDQEVLRLSVPRGPLGINASSDSVDPAMIPPG